MKEEKTAIYFLKNDENNFFKELPICLGDFNFLYVHFQMFQQETFFKIRFTILPYLLIIYLLSLSLHFSSGASGKEPACQCKRYETQVPALSQKDPLEKVMATHSSIVAWRIPWTEEPGGLLSIGSQRVGHK